MSLEPPPDHRETVIGHEIEPGVYVILVDAASIERYEITDDGCWNWTGGMTPNGYGKICVTLGAHRAVYQAHRGPVPEGLYLDHLCRNKRCVNPSHLEPVTPSENQRRARGFIAANMAKTHCPKGHPYSEENTSYQKRKTGRVCKTCTRIRCLRYYHKTYKVIKAERRGAMRVASPAS